MKRMYLGLVLVIAVPVLSSESCGDEFSIMTWNLEWFFDDIQSDNRSDLAKKMSAPDRSQWNWRRDAVAAALAQVEPTLVAVQEAESRRTMGYLASALHRNHKLKYRVACIDGAEPFTEQDVALLTNDDLWLRQLRQNRQTRQMYASKDYYHTQKHLESVFEIGDARDPEVITVINIHLRARADKSEIRQRQARLIHHWIAQRVANGENVVVLGDINTEEPGRGVADDSELGILCGRHTSDQSDDLIDLHSRLPFQQHRTHLLKGKAFDRILVSPAMISDDPERKDIVFESIEVRRDLAVRGEIDLPDVHWDQYWQADPEQRDLSDHWPILARFQIK